MKTSINIFTKCPFTGDPKTRLSPFFSKDERKFICKIMILNLMEELSSFDRSQNKVNIHVYPNYSHSFFDNLKNDFECHLFSQHGCNLIQRMDNFFLNECENDQRTILVGSDIPGLTANIISDAIKILDTHDLVIGPSMDGGFYLLGYCGNYHNVFTSSNLNATNLRQEAYQKKLSCEETIKLKDIDYPEDLLII